jgi:hypothetical protein
MTNPTFERAVSYLCLEEHRLTKLRVHVPHTVLAVGLGYGAPSAPRADSSCGAPSDALRCAPSPPPQQQQQGRHHCGRGGGGRSNGGYAGGGLPPANQMPPWNGGFNLWMGVVHAYTVPVPRLPSPASLALIRRLIRPSSPCRNSPTRRPRAACLPMRAPSRQAGTPRSSLLFSRLLPRVLLVACRGSWTLAPPLTWLLTRVTYPPCLPLPPTLASSSATALVFLSHTLVPLLFPPPLNHCLLTMF